MPDFLVRTVTKIFSKRTEIYINGAPPVASMKMYLKAVLNLKKYGQKFEQG